MSSNYAETAEETLGRFQVMMEDSVLKSAGT